MSSSQFCSNCGAAGSGRFCGKCGTALQGAAMNYPAAPPRQPDSYVSTNSSPVGFGQAISLFFKNYANFHGRASRPEFWWVFLFLVLLYGGLAILALIIGGAMISANPDGDSDSTMLGTFALIFTVPVLGLFLPNLTLAIRRLHDSDKSGFWYLILLVPYVGSIVWFVFMLLPSTPGQNKYERLH